MKTRSIEYPRPSVINIQTVCLCLFLAEPGSAMLEHFNHLRRQWASKAQKLLHSLKKITTVDIEPVLGNVCTCSHKVKERNSFIVLLSIFFSCSCNYYTFTSLALNNNNIVAQLPLGS